MLLLTRKTGETINIGDSVEVAVIEVRGNQVKLGITAPKHIEVHRSEIYRRIQADRELDRRSS